MRAVHTRKFASCPEAAPGLSTGLTYQPGERTQNAKQVKSSPEGGVRLEGESLAWEGSAPSGV